MTTKQPQPTPTPEEVLALLKEICARQKETVKWLKESNRRRAKQFAETTEQMKEAARKRKERFAETHDEIKETAEQMEKPDTDDWDTKLWDPDTWREYKEPDDVFAPRPEFFFVTPCSQLTDSLYEGDLTKLFKQQGIRIVRMGKSHKGVVSYTDEHGIEQTTPCGVGIIAENDEVVVVVKDRLTLRVSDVDEFLWTLPKITQFLPEHSGKKMYGVVAYLQSKDSAEVYAEKQGLFVINASGDSSQIINAEGFKAKDFA